MSRPIKPRDLVASRYISHHVIDAFNFMIRKHWDGKKARFEQQQVIEEILVRDPSLNKRSIFDLGYLNVESMYRAEGWKVEYDKPTYNEQYEPTFKFSK